MRHAKPLNDRLLENSKIDETGCRLWTLSRTKKGHGKIRLKEGPTTTAHRVAWTVWRGAIPKGLNVCHTCDVPHCINPEHLYLGTVADNNRDCKERGRLAVGSLNGGAKLDESKVAEMRRLADDGEPIAELARKFNISQPTAWSAIKQKTWRHVDHRKD